MMNKEVYCVAMRGRPIDNPSCRTAGLPTAQRLEPCRWGINTLTSVAKDNMILEIMEDDDNEQTI